jgi:cholesterol oxidase
MGAPSELDADVIVVGSGFGGSVAALRLAERGYRVVVLEQGRRVGPAEVRAASERLGALMWAPRLGMTGFFSQRVLRHLAVVGGVGVGGGSLVYAAVLLEPGPGFFADPAWAGLGVDWSAELAPHYATARRMLGAATTPFSGSMDEALRRTARRLGVEASFGPVTSGIDFRSEPSREGRGAPRPEHGAELPPRVACHGCGGCLTGCPTGAKRTLDRTYLALAERLGARVVPLYEVRALSPLEGGGFAVVGRDPLTGQPRPTLRARRVVLAAGVLGTSELLLRCRDELGTLPALSPRLGERVRTNSEAIVAIHHPGVEAGVAEGPAITSHFHADAATHVTQNRFPEGYRFMRFYMGPMVDDPAPARRALRTLAALVKSPARALAPLFDRGWNQHVTVLTVMQQADSELSLRLRRGPAARLFGALSSELVRGRRAPTFLPQANAAARAYAAEVGGTPQNNLLESVGNLSITAHVLGGCAMGDGPSRGVIDVRHEAYGHPGLFVFDGAAVSADVGVNPSLTITALAERAASLWPRRQPA